MFFKLYLQFEFDNFINDLYLTIFLGVIDWREAFFDPHVIAEVAELVAIELCPVI